MKNSMDLEKRGKLEWAKLLLSSNSTCLLGFGRLLVQTRSDLRVKFKKIVVFQSRFWLVPSRPASHRTAWTRLSLVLAFVSVSCNGSICASLYIASNKIFDLTSYSIGLLFVVYLWNNSMSYFSSVLYPP